MKTRKVKASHGIVCSMPGEFFGYFGWPSVARLDDGRLIAVASGLREHHICPFGRTVLCVSDDEGATWTSPRIVNDTPMDDRDAGIVPLGGEKLLLTWFSRDTRRSNGKWLDDHVAGLTEEGRRLWSSGMKLMTDKAKQRFEGSWLRISDDAGETWRPPMKAPANSPHGPIRLKSGALLYLGKECANELDSLLSGRIVATTSDDEGRSWRQLGSVPLMPKTQWNSHHEAHALELPDGRLIGMIRLENSGGPDGDVEKAGYVHFSMLQTESTDGGRTWSVPNPLGFHGSPPHLIRHSSGTLILSYGYRKEPFGQRMAFSSDEGRTWSHDWILRDDGPDGDLGYPATVELPGGDLLTVYYQKPGKASDRCALLCSRWSLPKKI